MSKLASFPLNGCDTFMLAMDYAMQRDGRSHNVCHLLLTFPHATDLNSLLDSIVEHETFASVTRLRLETPLLRTPRWIASGSPMKRGEVMIHARCTSAEELQTFIISHHLNVRTASPFGVIALPNLNDGPSLLFYWHHALCDAHGGEMLIQRIATPTNANTPSLTPSPLPHVPRMNALRRAHHTKRFIYAQARPAIVRLARTGTPSPDHRYRKVIFSQEQTTTIDGAVKRLTGGMFPTALFLAATARAASRTPATRINENAPLFVPVPHDMRRTTKQRSPLSNQVSVAFFKIQPHNTSLIDLTNDVIEQLHDTIAEQHHHGMLDFLRCIRRLPARVFWKIIEHPTAGHPASLYFSDIGASLSSIQTIGGAPVVYATHYPPNLSPPGLTTVWSRYRGSLEVTVCYDRATLNDDHLDTFERNLRRDLLEAAA